MRSEETVKPLLSIGEVAARLKISTETIRLYERRGLIIVPKADNNQRVYSESDVERIKCIRAAINEHKISIEGIRRMQSLVPCWKHIHCPEEQRNKCPAYFRISGGCWTYRHVDNDCGPLDCRDCKVYQLCVSCENIKSLIYRDILPASENHGGRENKS